MLRSWGLKTTTKLKDVRICCGGRVCKSVFSLRGLSLDKRESERERDIGLLSEKWSRALGTFGCITVGYALFPTSEEQRISQVNIQSHQERTVDC